MVLLNILKIQEILLLKEINILDGINFEYNTDDPSDYWEQLEEDFNENVRTEETENSYISSRPMKINAALKYSFGKKRSKFFYTKTHKQYYYNSIGFQFHTIMRPLKPQFSFTSFYEKSLSKKIHTKFTHTINDYSSAYFWFCNLFTSRKIKYIWDARQYISSNRFSFG